MKILLIGSGGREHALAWKLAQSKLCDKLFIAPGNPGMAALGTLVPLKANDLEGIKKFAVDNSIDLTVVGPEEPLVLGLADLLRAAGLLVFGPTAAGAALEGSKAFSKAFMEKYKVPTAMAAPFTSVDFALRYAKGRRFPLVLKADGLAAGKGVIIVQTYAEAEKVLREMLEGKAFGAASEKVLVEDFMDGEEVSLLCFSDGTRLVPMVPAQDHKRVRDGDQGPNTGGMGAYSPAPILPDDQMAEVERLVLKPTLKGMKAEGFDYRGCLYVGLMMGSEGPQVVEYNCRFGDPETQVVVPRMDFDLGEVMAACAEGNLEMAGALKWKKESAVCVVLAAGGYPEKPETGKAVEGMEKAAGLPETFVFQASTQSAPGGKVLSAGGRVLGVSSLGVDLKQALSRVYQGVGMIHFDGMHFRRDIGARALKK